MKRFKILRVDKITTQESGKVVIPNSRLNKSIELPYPEFSANCILVVANPIDLSFDESGIIVGQFSSVENLRTCYFIKPYTINDLNYWQYIWEKEEDWIPFFPEQKELNYLDSGEIISFYKDISFNENWTPISHALYVNRVNAQRSYNLDDMDVDVDRFEEVSIEEYENNDSNEGYDVYATELFGEFEEDCCEDECWACAKLLQKEMLYEVHLSTVIDGRQYRDYKREVFGWDVIDAINLMLQSVANAEQRNLHPEDVSVIEVFQDGTIVYKQ